MPEPGTASRAVPVPIGRPGGRTARIRAAVLRATEEELGERGYDGLTVDAVAARSAVHRTTIYRRWKTTGGLVADLLAAGRDDAWAPADTGRLRTDLVALNRELHAALTAESGVTAAVIAAAFRVPEAAAALTGFWDDRYRRSAVVVARAVERGEVPARTDADRVLTAATAPVYHELVLRRRPLSRAAADRWAITAAEAAVAGLHVD